MPKEKPVADAQNDSTNRTGEAEGLTDEQTANLKIQWRISLSEMLAAEGPMRIAECLAKLLRDRALAELDGQHRGFAEECALSYRRLCCELTKLWYSSILFPGDQASATVSDESLTGQTEAEWLSKGEK